MPTYLYECSSCCSAEEVVKPISQIDEQELCTTCAKPMNRIITAVQISPTAKAFEAHHNWAFGKVVTSKRQLEEERRRVSGETGREIVEVGTDDLKSVKKTKKKYTVDGLNF